MPSLRKAIRDQSVALLVVAVCTAIAVAIYGFTQASGLAWVALILYEATLVLLSERWEVGRPLLSRLLTRILLAAWAGLVPVACAQMEVRFSDEEFYAGLQALLLAFVWFAVASGYAWLSRRNQRRAPAPGVPDQCPSLGPGLVLISAGLVVIAWVTLVQYQTSFYSSPASDSEWVTAEQPFRVQPVAGEARAYDGLEVHARLVDRVRLNPNKGACEYGMLALAMGDRAWASAFRDELLHEAREGSFTEPAHSVKIGQYLAAERLYYYVRVREAFPSLFSPDEQRLLQKWFLDINERAGTVEWVDWLYSAAFSMWPEGFYENQENGAGLVALLEAQGITGGERSAINRDYLARNPRGWEARFRNTDDAVLYQGEWITNALFQLSYTGRYDPQKRANSFEWLLLQSVPDGLALQYNHPISVSMASTLYLGATLLQDERYVWLAGRAVDKAESTGEYLYAQPGIERPVPLVGRSPEIGSALLYGDSGLPNQVGPLAPDKIVFRDGWSPNAAYMLLNLRFTGWHRYKGTNALILFYQGSPLIVEELAGEPAVWLPVGRSLFRDKRIPRENLNGLLVPRSGLSAVLTTLTGLGSPWAQDPPHYARVEAFQAYPGLDYSRTAIDSWHGWRHRREIYFYHQGPVVILDQATGPAQQRAALTWQILAQAQAHPAGRFSLGTTENPAEMVLLSPAELPSRLDESALSPGHLRLTHDPGQDGTLELATVILTREWVGAQVEMDTTGRKIRIHKGMKAIEVGLSEVPNTLK